EGLDVVDQGRVAEQSRLHRKRWLVAGLTSLAFDRIEQRSLLTADVRARPAPHLEVEAQQPRCAGLSHGVLHAPACHRILGADVDVALLAAPRWRSEGPPPH